MSTKRKSDVWLFFEIEDEACSNAKGKICFKKVSRAGKSHTTTNLYKHLKTYHQDELMKEKRKKIEETVEDDSTENTDSESPVITNPPSHQIITEIPSGQKSIILQSSSSNFSQPSTSGLSTACSSKDNLPYQLKSQSLKLPSSKVLKQPTIASVIQRKATFRPDDIKAKAITKKIIEMICLDNQPFSIVEDKGFCNLLHHLEPRYSIPKRKHFSKTELPRLYEHTKVIVTELLKSEKHVSVTTDLWTSTANDDYMALTCHFFDGNFQWKHICLEVIPFPEISHTGEAISKFLESVLQDWKIDKKCHVVVRAKNVVSAMAIGNFIGIPCLAHTLQLVVRDGLLCQKSVINLSALCRKVVGHFKHSSKATKHLKAAQETIGLPHHKLIQDEPTRWNSTKHMMDRLLEQRRAICFLAPEVNLPVEISGQDWELMSNVVSLLKIFDDATFQCSSAQTTISEVIPIVNSTINLLESMLSTIPGLKTSVGELVKSLKVCYCDLEVRREYTLATLLDPRLKGTVFVNSKNLESVKEQLIQEAKKACSSSKSLECSTDKLKRKMWARYSMIMKDTDKACSDFKHTAEYEVAQYLMEPLESPDCKIGNFWNAKISFYPRLSELSTKFLSAPPATIFSERLFSTSGTICDRKRNRLDPQTVKMLVFLNKNLEV